MARNRIIYASQSVWANGEVLYRVQSLGSTVSFTSENIFELGHLDIIDAVDDVPAVTITLNTNDFGDVRTMAILAQVSPERIAMDVTADVTNGNLVSGDTYLHGVAIADFAVVCGNLPGVTLWSPIQDECDIGTLANNIEQSMFFDAVYVNSLEFSYTTGANATENYGAETDNKMYLLNEGAFINWETPEVTAAMTDFTLASGVAIPILSTSNAGFLRKTTNGEPAITVYSSANNTMVNYAIKPNDAVDYDPAAHFSYDPAALDGTAVGPYTVTVPTDLTLAAEDRLQVVYSANGYVDAMNQYFIPYVGELNSGVGALRQGQIEVYIVDAGSTDIAWRLTGVTISADLTREPLMELGHLRAYDRPLTLPVPITVNIDSTAGDLENWARFAGKLAEFRADTLDDISLTDLMNKADLILMVKVYVQTDEEAGGTGASRRVNTDQPVGHTYFVDGALSAAPYALGDREYALKTLVVKNLKITDEGNTLDLGSNATQTFGFRSDNDLFVVKGDLSPALAAELMRNPL